MSQTFYKVTIYHRGDFGYSKVEAIEARCWFGEYAQHPTALFVEVKPKGERKLEKFVESSDYSVVVVDGWGHPDLNSFDETTTGSVTVKKSLYPSCDGRYNQDFDEFISRYVEKSKAVVLADFRKQD